jgi:Raf kinase inhibitor-like YbhB/YbcL family protein
MEDLMRSALLSGIILLSLPALAQENSGPPVLAKELVKARAGGKLMVMSPAFSGGDELDDKYTQNGSNMSPPIAWSKGPTGTRSYVLLAEDSGVNRHDPVFHWVMYNIPSNVTNLSENISQTATLDTGAMQGLNVRKAAGFLGPKPPAGQTHAYHFEVFALNTTLKLDPATTDRKAVVDAMKGHVLAMGDIIANYTGR